MAQVHAMYSEWVCNTAEEPRVQETQYFIRGLLANLLYLCPGGRNYLYYTDQGINLPSAWRVLLSLSPKAVSYILENIVWNKSC